MFYNYIPDIRQTVSIPVGLTQLILCRDTRVPVLFGIPIFVINREHPVY